MFPGPWTWRSLEDAAQQKLLLAWDQTAAIGAWMINLRRRGRPVKPAQLNPLRTLRMGGPGELRLTTDNIAALKVLV